jgi:hypothetical protein
LSGPSRDTHSVSRRSNTRVHAAGAIRSVHGGPGAGKHGGGKMSIRRGRPAREDDGASTARWQTIVAIVIAVFGVGGTLGATYLSQLGDQHVQQLVVNEDHSTEKRDKRSEIYPSYLRSAATYRDATHATWLAIDLRKRTDAPYSTLYPVLRIFEEARRSYQDQRTLLGMYGSSAAWNAQIDIADSLPAAYGKVTVTHDADYARFDRGYRAFLARFCADVNPDAKPECTQAEDVVPAK